MIITFILLAVSAFLIGFFCGYKKENPPRTLKSKSDDSELLILQKEYENFLNYDGTEQF